MTVPCQNCGRRIYVEPDATTLRQYICHACWDTWKPPAQTVEVKVK